MPLVGKIGAVAYTLPLEGEAKTCMPLSEYVVSLDRVAKSRYFDKLKVFLKAATPWPRYRCFYSALFVAMF